MNLPRLMLVTDRHRVPPGELVPRVAAACAGGVRFIQVREKDLSPSAVAELVRELRGQVPPDTLLTINGLPELALELGCGLHLPASAPPPSADRPALYGRSAHDAAEVESVLREGVDYIIIGPVYTTASKPGHSGIGTGGLRSLVLSAPSTHVYGIGGIEPGRVPAVLSAGAYGVAVCGAIVESQDARGAAESFRNRLAGARPEGFEKRWLA